MSRDVALTRDRMIRHFIQHYGAQKLRWFVLALKEGLSGQHIANELGVSRERVRQWKNAFGSEIRVYQVDPAVQRALRKAMPGRALQIQ